MARIKGWHVAILVLILNLELILALRLGPVDTDLARNVSVDEETRTQYWLSLTTTLEQFIDQSYTSASKRFEENVAGVPLNVSQQCLDIVRYILRNPLQHPWTAKSMLITIVHKH